MSGEDPSTEPKVLHGDAPNASGWFAIYSTPEMRPEDLVGAAHIREGVSIEDARTAWQENSGAEVGEVFDAYLTRDQVILKAKDLQGLPPVAGGTGTPSPDTPPAPAPAPAPPPPPAAGGATPGKSSASGRASRPKSNKSPRSSPGGATERAGASKGSRLGKKGGSSENDIWALFAGFAKGVIGGYDEIGVGVYDAFGAVVEAASDTYKHDYLSSIGRAVGEQGRPLEDVLVQSAAGKIESVAKLIRDAQRGDYYAAGVEAQNVPVPGAPGLPVGKLVKAGAGRVVRGVGTRRRLRGDNDFSDISAELDLDPPGTGAAAGKGKTLQTRIEDNVRAAQDAGWVDAAGNPRGPVQATASPHGHASKLRKATGHTGKTRESAHNAATSLVRDLPGYSRNRALTMQLPPDVHLSFDNHWKRWIRIQRKILRREKVTLSDALRAQRRALSQTEGLSRGTRNTLISMLEREYAELAADLPNGMATLVDLPKL